MLTKNGRTDGIHQKT